MLPETFKGEFRALLRARFPYLTPSAGMTRIRFLGYFSAHTGTPVLLCF